MGREKRLSRVLSRAEEIIEDMALSLPELLSSELYEEYRHLCLDHTLNPPTGFVPDLLGHYAIQSLILELHLSYRSTKLFHFGLRLLPEDFLNPHYECYRIEARSGKKKQEGMDLPPGMSHVQRWCWQNDHPIIASMVVLKPLRRMCANLLDFELMPIIEAYYPSLPEQRECTTLNINAILHRILAEIIRPAVSSGIPVTISHFHFQELNIYLETTGEQQTREFLDEIRKIFHRNLKKKDKVIQLSPVSYLVLSPGATTRIMSERFKHIFFMIRSLILEYKLDICTVQQLPVEIHDIVQKLKL